MARTRAGAAEPGTVTVDEAIEEFRAGRPVILQSTGFEDVLPTGQGLFAVTGIEEAAEAVRAIRADYARHSAAATAIAREHLDAARVLERLLEPVGASA